MLSPQPDSLQHVAVWSAQISTSITTVQVLLTPSPAKEHRALSMPSSAQPCNLTLMHIGKGRKRCLDTYKGKAASRLCTQRT